MLIPTVCERLLQPTPRVALLHHHPQLLYMFIADPSDTYLGRILAGLDPLDPSFTTLPAHWRPVNPLQNDRIREAMSLMYGPILRARSNTPHDPTAFLLRCLPAVINHSDFLKDFTTKIPGHPFASIPLKTLQQVNQLTDRLVEAVREAYEDKQAENGHLTAAKLEEILQTNRTELKTYLSVKIEAL